MAEEISRRTPAPAFVDPYAAFRSEFDRLFNGFFGGRGLAAATDAGWPAGGTLVPATDVKESDAAITLAVELPGLSEEDVEVSLQDGILTMKGEKRFERDEEKDAVHLVERRYGSFRRSFRVPDTVDPEAVAASFDKGVLTVTLPKRAEAANPVRKIPVKAA